LLAGGTGSFAGTPLPTHFSLSGVAVDINPLNVVNEPQPISDAIFVASDLSVASAGAPDIVEAWAPGATGNTPPIAMMITFLTCVETDSAGDCIFFEGNPMAIPEGIAFIPGETDDVASTNAVSEGPGDPGDFYVTQLTGAPFDNDTGAFDPPGAGSVLEYLPFAGTGTGLDQVESTFTVGELVDSDCAEDESTDLFGPVGIALDSSNNLWVVNSGDGTGTSYVTEYPAGAGAEFVGEGQCTPPIDLVGDGVLEQGEYDAISPIDGSLWVSDLNLNSVFEFDIGDGFSGGDGAVVTTIAGKHSRLKGPMGIAMDADGDLYVANNLRNQVLEFEDPAFSGLLNVKPDVILQGAKTRLNQPVGVALIDGVPPFPSPTETTTATATATPTETPTPTATSTPPPG
jgi:hypothetical protein